MPVTTQEKKTGLCERWLTKGLFGYRRLDGNALTGPIPTEIGQLTWLIDLAVAENSLSGSLPTELAVLASSDSCDPDFATPATSHCLYTL